MDNNIILGLDVSTTTIGICLLQDDGSDYGKLIELTHVSPKSSKDADKTEALFQKVEIFREFIKKYKDFKISTIVIEAPLLRSNNVETVSVLLRFNGMVSMACYEELGVVPNYISSYEAREYAFPELISVRKYNKKGDVYPKAKLLKSIDDGKFVLFGAYPWEIDKKEILQQRVAELFPDIKWIYNKKNELSKENFDSSDAYIALLGFLNKTKHGDIKMTVEPLTCDEEKTSYKVKYWGKEEIRTLYFK